MAVPNGMPPRTRLEEVRRERGISISELAQEAGLSRNTIVAIENGMRTKKRDLYAIAYALCWPSFAEELIEAPGSVYTELALKLEIKKAGLSQKAFAKLAGVGEATVTNTLAGKSRPTRLVLEKMAAALAWQGDPDELLQYVEVAQDGPKKPQDGF